jgi:hypothetical protein
MNYSMVFDDLRIGYDCTYNVMIRCDCSTVTMRLIDLESLTQCLNFEGHPKAFHQDYDNSFNRYYQNAAKGRSPSNYSHLKFGWWQCVLVAHCWTSRTLYDDFSASEVVAQMKGGTIYSIWNCFRNYIPAKSCNQLHNIMKITLVMFNERHITETLDIFRQLFEEVEKKNREKSS